MRLDDKGAIIAYGKVRGKKNALRTTLDAMAEHAQNGEAYSGKCYISNSACMEDAQAVAKLVKEKFPNVGEIIINSIGTTIGSHTGPGTVALFFWGEER